MGKMKKFTSLPLSDKRYDTFDKLGLDTTGKDLYLPLREATKDFYC
jgi:hypothetical protein